MSKGAITGRLYNLKGNNGQVFSGNGSLIINNATSQRLDTNTDFARESVARWSGKGEQPKEVSMELKTIAPELLVDDVDRSVEFYKQVLGFHVSRTAETVPRFYAELVNGSARLMLLSRKFILAQVANLPQQISNGASIVQVSLGSPDAARKAYADLEKQVNVVLPLRVVGNGIVEFAFLDPDGHMIVILGR